jgi:hypothetical protein
MQIGYIITGKLRTLFAKCVTENSRGYCVPLMFLPQGKMFMVLFPLMWTCMLCEGREWILLDAESGISVIHKIF